MDMRYAPARPSPEKVSLSVYSAAEGKRYRLMVKRSDVGRLRMQKICGQLARVTGIPMEMQRLSVNGHPLTNDSLMNTDFILDPHNVIRLDKVAQSASSSTLAGHERYHELSPLRGPPFAPQSLSSVNTSHAHTVHFEETPMRVDQSRSYAVDDSVTSAHSALRTDLSKSYANDSIAAKSHANDSPAAQSLANESLTSASHSQRTASRSGRNPSPPRYMLHRPPGIAPAMSPPQTTLLADETSAARNLSPSGISHSSVAAQQTFSGPAEPLSRPATLFSSPARQPRERSKSLTSGTRMPDAMEPPSSHARDRAPAFPRDEGANVSLSHHGGPDENRGGEREREMEREGDEGETRVTRIAAYDRDTATAETLDHEVANVFLPSKAAETRLNITNRRHNELQSEEVASRQRFQNSPRVIVQPMQQQQQQQQQQQRYETQQRTNFHPSAGEREREAAGERDSQPISYLAPLDDSVDVSIAHFDGPETAFEGRLAPTEVQQLANRLGNGRETREVSEKPTNGAEKRRPMDAMELLEQLRANREQVLAKLRATAPQNVQKKRSDLGVEDDGERSGSLSLSPVPSIASTSQTGREKMEKPPLIPQTTGSRPSYTVITSEDAATLTAKSENATNQNTTTTSTNANATNATAMNGSSGGSANAHRSGSGFSTPQTAGRKSPLSSGVVTPATTFLTAEVAELRREKSELEATIRTLTADRDSQLERLEFAHAERESRQAAELSQLRKDYENVKSEVSSESRKLQAKEAETLQVRIREMEEALREFEAQKEAWRSERDEMQQKWSEETEILTMIWKEDVEKYNRGKQQLLADFAKERETLAAENEARAKEAQDELHYYKDEVARLQEEIEGLNSKVSTADQNARRHSHFVQSAKAALDELRSSIATLSGDRKLSDLVVAASTETAMERERAQHLVAENQRLLEKLKRETAMRRRLHNVLEDMKGNIRVIVRMRPLLASDSVHARSARKGADLSGSVEVVDEFTARVSDQTHGSRSFEFYRVMDGGTSQGEMFEEVKPLLQSALDGYNICIMAYGQTGSGKTYTITGSESEEPEERGVIPRAVEELFQLLEEEARNGLDDDDVAYVVRCSMVELYLDSFTDLLSKAGNGLSSPTSSPRDHKTTFSSGSDVFNAALAAKKPLSSSSAGRSAARNLVIRQHPTGGMYIQGTSYHRVRTAGELLQLLRQGLEERRVHETELNELSSRSHTIFTIKLDLTRKRLGGTTTSRMCFVDLAGSERVSKSKSTGERFREAQHINKSLAALGDVISALSTKEKFVPYRNSKLTLALQDVIGGNSKTLFFANVTPVPASISETLSTLSFGARVRTVRNAAVKNVSPMKAAAHLRGATVPAHRFAGKSQW